MTPRTRLEQCRSVEQALLAEYQQLQETEQRVQQRAAQIRDALLTNQGRIEVLETVLQEMEDPQSEEEGDA